MLSPAYARCLETGHKFILGGEIHHLCKERAYYG